MPSEHDLKPLITRALGAAEADRALAYQQPDIEVLRITANQLMEITPITPGICVLMSAAWALHLRDKYNLPAVAVAGDLCVAGRWIFRATQDLPQIGKSGRVINMSWRGHAWVEIGGLVCDISIFRTIYSTTPDNVARQYFENLFGRGRGVVLIPELQMPEGLRYRRRQVMNKNQLEGFYDSLMYMIERKQDN